MFLRLKRIWYFKEHQAQGERAKPYILIIDEINRANLPMVFGELLYALEYRNRSVESMYTIGYDNGICFPHNLCIIWTMNTADRSARHIDYAIRRRFAFEYILPKSLEKMIWQLVINLKVIYSIRSRSCSITTQVPGYARMRDVYSILGFDYDKVIPALIIYPTINGNDLDVSPKFLKSDYRYVNIYKCSIKLPTTECRWLADVCNPV